MNSMIPIIIPAYEPDERLITLICSLVKSEELIIIVDDGSGYKYKPIFKKCMDILGDKGILLLHEVNRGKGRALKTGFSYILQNFPEVLGVVTADSDGQHNVRAIESVKGALRLNSKSLILGVRSFDGEEIPWKSAFGNKLTIKILSYLSGIKVSDTQTGLRGIPINFMEKLLYTKGERFEFETQMLVDSSEFCSIIEVPVETIYDSKENHQTHFNPILDSIKIYRIFGQIFLKYIFSSFSASILDLLLFTIFCHFLKISNILLYVMFATVGARLASGFYNYYINYRFVFHSSGNMGRSAFKYFVLAIIQMSCSALLVTIGVNLLPFIQEVVIKMIVDSILFVISYCVQRKYVF